MVLIGWVCKLPHGEIRPFLENGCWAENPTQQPGNLNPSRVIVCAGFSQQRAPPCHWVRLKCSHAFSKFFDRLHWPPFLKPKSWAGLTNQHRQMWSSGSLNLPSSYPIILPECISPNQPAPPITHSAHLKQHDIRGLGSIMVRERRGVAFRRLCSSIGTAPSGPAS